MLRACWSRIFRPDTPNADSKRAEPSTSRAVTAQRGEEIQVGPAVERGLQSVASRSTSDVYQHTSREERIACSIVFDLQAPAELRNQLPATATQCARVGTGPKTPQDTTEDFRAVTVVCERVLCEVVPDSAASPPVSSTQADSGESAISASVADQAIRIAASRPSSAGTHADSPSTSTPSLSSSPTSATSSPVSRASSGASPPVNRRSDIRLAAEAQLVVSIDPPARPQRTRQLKHVYGVGEGESSDEERTDGTGQSSLPRQARAHRAPGSRRSHPSRAYSAPELGFHRHHHQIITHFEPLERSAPSPSSSSSSSLSSSVTGFIATTTTYVTRRLSVSMQMSPITSESKPKLKLRRRRSNFASATSTSPTTPTSPTLETVHDTNLEHDFSNLHATNGRRCVNARHDERAASRGARQEGFDGGPNSTLRFTQVNTHGSSQARRPSRPVAQRSAASAPVNASDAPPFGIALCPPRPPALSPATPLLSSPDQARRSNGSRRSGRLMVVNAD